MSKKDKILKHILSHPNADAVDIAIKFETSRRTVNQYKYRLRKEGKLPPAEPQLKNTVSYEEIIKKERSRRLAKRNVELEKEIMSLKKQLSVLTEIENFNPKKFSIPIPVNKTTGESCGIIQWSDWHVEEIVLADAVNKVNEYNPQICRQRVSNLFQNSIKLVNTQRSATNINDLILHLGGDFITGYIHPEGEQENAEAPIPAIFTATKLLKTGLEYILNYGKFKNIKIVCSRGNHGRTTKRMQSNDYNMNYEIFIYYSLMEHFLNEKSIAFQVPKSSYGYVTAYNRPLRFFHGNQVKFQGGIGGMTIPLQKLIYRLNANMPAFYNFMGDKHTYQQGTPDCQVNGSLIGYNGYAEEKGFKYEEPVQAFTLLDSKRGITIKAPIFCK